MCDDTDFVSPEAFAALGDGLLQRAPGFSDVVCRRRFRALFGASPSACALVWSLLAGSRLTGSKPVHLLWAFMFLKVYTTEHVHATLASVDEKTLRKWSWVFIVLIANLQLVNWSARKTGNSIGGCWASVDGTDCPINEPSPFSPMWFSFKLKSAALRYEIAIAVQNGKVVWAHGPPPAGSHPDLKKFRSGLKQKLEQVLNITQLMLDEEPLFDIQF